ncbi:hypothetical protein CTAYLR_007612 [Chrysophaeum taylorii]|uniref:Bifunctional lysine-specific demethylase and histidyl-hydroxylase n=1 Tax=Chrysophaeum taylorii TaxID=2483200 RepID=A0AAD7U739_9STRA|nr:hypothetical protein CTAYLR_007612 [Chrysophaeum taylorii]
MQCIVVNRTLKKKERTPTLVHWRSLAEAWAARPECGAIGDALALRVVGLETHEVRAVVAALPRDGEDDALANVLLSLGPEAASRLAPPSSPAALAAWCEIAVAAARQDRALAKRWAREATIRDAADARLAAVLSLFLEPRAVAATPLDALLTPGFWRRDFERAAVVVRAGGVTRHPPDPCGADYSRMPPPPPPPPAYRRPVLAEVEAFLDSTDRPSLAPLRDADCEHEDTVDLAFSVLEDGRGLTRGADYAIARCPGGDGRGCDTKSARTDASTVVILGADARFRSCAELRASLQSHLAVGCSVNLYCTPPGAQGLDVHADDHDVFVVQIAGCKVWRLYDATGRPRLLGPKPKAPAEMLRRGAGATWRLEPGDVLYLPRGVYHAATADDHSIHVTIGCDLDPLFSWEGSVHAALKKNHQPLSVHAAVKVLAESDDALDSLRRAALPALLTTPPPNDHDHDDYDDYGLFFFEEVLPALVDRLEQQEAHPVSTKTTTVEEFWWYDGVVGSPLAQDVRVSDFREAAAALRRFGARDDRAAKLSEFLAWQRNHSLDRLRQSTYLAEFYLVLQRQ